MVRKSKGLSKRHISVLKFLVEYQGENGRPPGIREIGEAANISSTSVVNYYLEQLEKMGYIERDGRVSRGLRLTDKVNEVVQVITDLIRVPILGRIVASEPAPVPSSDFSYYGADSAIEVPVSLLPKPEKNKQLFALEVQGDSMIDAMVSDGDFVIMSPISSDDEVKNGEMVSVWLPNRDETTLKYFYKEKEGYRLQPANPTMGPILVDKNEAIEAKGRVIMVIRSTSLGNIPTTYQPNANEFVLPGDRISIEFEHFGESKKSLTISLLQDEILPYLEAIRTIQHLLDKAEKRKSQNIVRIRSISQHSPITATLDSVTRAISFIVTRIDPNRKRLEELNEEQIKAQTTKTEIEIKSIEIDIRRKQYDLLSNLLEKQDENLTDKQKDKLIQSMIYIATSDFRIRKKGDKKGTGYLQ